MSNDFVIVATLNTPTEARLVRHQLEAEEICVFLPVSILGSVDGRIKNLAQ